MHEGLYSLYHLLSFNLNHKFLVFSFILTFKYSMNCSRNWRFDVQSTNSNATSITTFAPSVMQQFISSCGSLLITLNFAAWIICDHSKINVDNQFVLLAITLFSNIFIDLVSIHVHVEVHSTKKSWYLLHLRLILMLVLFHLFEHFIVRCRIH